MANQATGPLTGVILEEVQYSLRDLSTMCCVHADYIVDLVEEGIIEPASTDNTTWIFSGESIKRVRTVMNLQQDLGINMAGVALALELLEEVEALRSELQKRPPNE